jgi:hypothetical protein
MDSKIYEYNLKKRLNDFKEIGTLYNLKKKW